MGDGKGRGPSRTDRRSGTDRRSLTDRRSPTDRESERAIAAAEQAAADAEQTASEADQTAADRDQTVASSDTAAVRLRTADERDRGGASRDELGRARDLAAEARDRAAEARDIAAAGIERDPQEASGLEDSPGGRFEKERLRAVEARSLAAADRERAARDREEAAKHRAKGAEDRVQSGSDRERASIDELTGVSNRSIGLPTLARELERASRQGTPVCLAFVDVDGLKAINDRDGHAAGDELLRRVGLALKVGLRPYDPVVRVGGDEFVCAISDADLPTGRERLERIAAAVSERGEYGSISFGIIAVAAEESLADALARADAEMCRTRPRGPDGRRLREP